MTKKIWRVVVLVLFLLIAGGSLYTHLADSLIVAHSTKHIISKQHSSLKLIAKNKATYNYLVANSNQKIENLSDNQGSGELLYYNGDFANKRIQIYASENQNGIHWLFPTYKVTGVNVY